MIQRMVTSALFAGFAAGLLAALLHFAFIQNLILQSEQYESGELTHFSSGSDPNSPAAAPAPDAMQGMANMDHSAPAATDGAAGDEPSAVKRNAFTVLFDVLVYVAYGLILCAAFALAERFGKRVTAREGLIWGVAGFAAFQMMPAMGLAPNLPGTIAADLVLRQQWWWGTVAATATGLALLAFGRGPLPIIAAIALLAAPHFIGAPQAEQYWGVNPPELASTFAARTLGAGLVIWATLGWLAGHFWSPKTA